MSAGISPGARTFAVRLAQSGLQCEVDPDETIVQALARNGVIVQTSCQEGLCGTCLVTVLEGIPEHHDQLLTADEKARGDVMCLCVSRAVSPVLVLDL